MIIKNSKVYDQLKFITQILLPALGTLYFALAGIWGLPSAEEVVGSIVALDTFLGILLGISGAAYQQLKSGGTIDVLPQGEKTVYSLNLDKQPEDLVDGEQVTFTVNRPIQ